MTQDKRYGNLLYLDYFGAALQPLRLQLEQNTTARLLRLWASLADESLQLGEVLSHYFGDTSADSDSMGEQQHNAARAGQGSSSSGSLQDESTARGDATADEFTELYLKQMHLHPISITCTVQLDPL